MTVLEEYKLSVDVLIRQLKDGRTDNEFLQRVANKLEEMMQIVVNVGITNGVMANNLQIMINSNNDI